MLWGCHSKFIYLYDILNFEKITIVETQKVITKIMQYGNVIMVGQDEGYIELIDMETV